MKRPHELVAITLLVSLLHPANAVRTQDKARGFQYRFKDVSIPSAHEAEPKRSRFSSVLAKNHLDLGAELWAKQKKCVSCHTHGIYTLVRPALTPYWGKPSQDVRSFIAQQAKKMRDDGIMTDSSPTQMAYIAAGLAMWDAQFHETTSPETDAALRYLFAMQADDGSIRVKFRWPPLNSGTYHGTIMAAMATATAPDWLSNLEDEELMVKIGKLKDFLREISPKNDHERLLLLWASTRLPDLIDEKQQRDIVEMLWRQQRNDGGWSIRTFATSETWGGGKRAEKLKEEPDYDNPPSDGYQTGLAVVVLRDYGISADDPGIAKAVKWLQSNQRESGRWWTRSLNTDSRFHFISYSGTAYSALALAKCNSLQHTESQDTK